MTSRTTSCTVQRCNMQWLLSLYLVGAVKSVAQNISYFHRTFYILTKLFPLCFTSPFNLYFQLNFLQKGKKLKRDLNLSLKVRKLEPKSGGNLSPKVGKSCAQF